MSFARFCILSIKFERGKGKVDTELKEQLKTITKEILSSIKVEELTKTQKITFLKSSLAYLLPKEYINDTYIRYHNGETGASGPKGETGYTCFIFDKRKDDDEKDKK